MRCPFAWAVAATLTFSVGLSACGERSQVLDRSARKPDAQPWAVSEAALPAFRARGWKDGDKIAWEEQIRTRNQAQNDYQR